MSSRLSRDRSVSRRRLMALAASAAGLVAARPVLAPAARATPRFQVDPFALGVASGDPSPDGFVLWTRLAPEPLAPQGGMSPEAVEIGYEIAVDPAFHTIVRSGALHAHPEEAHSVHLEIGGLAPDRRYWYRFTCGPAESPIGRTRTLPAPGQPTRRLRFATVSCQHYGLGHFNAYRAMLDDGLDLVFHLGDYVYETGGATVRPHPAEPETLDDYRMLHALYKSDAGLRAAHAAYPFVATWDDHEVDDDYAGASGRDDGPTEAFLRRRAAAYKAYYEHMPLRRISRLEGGAMRLYRGLAWGDLAEFSVLDTRQYRSDHACELDGRRGGRVLEDCAERERPERTMLGTDQEAWLDARLVPGRARWSVIAQQTLMSPFDQKLGPDRAWWSDGWDGYPAARRRLLGSIAGRGVPNAVVLGGDLHSFWVADLTQEDGSDAPIATELVTTSVSAPGLESLRSHLPENPHIRYFEPAWRGYLRCEVTPALWTADLRITPSVAVPSADAKTLRRFAIESGRPGAVPA